MKVLFVSSEAVPLVKVGGLADVAGSLPGALRDLGHDVRVVIPHYRSIDTTRFTISNVISSLSWPLIHEAGPIGLELTETNGVPIYLLDLPRHFGSEQTYSGADLDRFYFFSRGVFEILPHLDWQPDVVHCHDWLTALVIMWLKKAHYQCATVFTIHNLAYQGVFDDIYMNRRGLREDWTDLPEKAPSLPMTFMAQAVLRADAVTTVSETYAREITTPDYGNGLEALLNYRSDALTGITNGLDYNYWNPLTDQNLPVNFDSAGLKRRAQNRYALQRVSGLPVNGSSMVVGMVQRLDEQKGLDILAGAVEKILSGVDSQFVILGRGWEKYESLLKQLALRFPRQVAAIVAFEEPLARLIYSGCDVFLMPSRFEPCGLGQLIAMRYGALPIVHHTGGLVDTVPGFNSDLTQGNGFVFHGYRPESLLAAANEASVAFNDKERWRSTQQRIMQLDFSWAVSARKYEALYRKVSAISSRQSAIE